MEPEIHETAYVHPKSAIHGNVRIGKDCSVWPFASIRAEMHAVKIGERTNVQDNVSIHTCYDHGCKIGRNVTIGHGAVVHACTIEDSCVIGMGAILLDGAQIEEGSFIAAGAVVTNGTRVPKGSVVMGVPGKVVRSVSRDEKDYIQKNAQWYVDAKERYKKGEIR